MRKNLVLGFGDGEESVAANAAVLVSKLSQISNGFSYLHNEDPKAKKKAIDIHDAKLEALKEIVETNAGKPILVALSFERDYERIREMFPESEKLGGQDSVDRWNAGKIPMLLMH